LETEFKEVVKLLVDSGCSVNICDADGQTPLHLACSAGYVDEARALPRYSLQALNIGVSPILSR
jgi:ankyrin repeat protein